MTPKRPEPRADNFRLLDPDAPRTKRIIEAALTGNVPWHPVEDVPTFQP